MYRKILVAYNGTPESRLALQECVRLEPAPSTEIYLLAVVVPQPVLLIGEFAAAALPSEEEERVEREAMEKVLESGRSFLSGAGLQVATRLEVGEPVDVITGMVEKLGIDLVIVGHSRHKPFAMRWWRGSMDALLVERVRCSVLVAADPHHGS